ncbi:TetR/AcrR family transcriptional regulator [Nocardia takedensis]|uniref:TetR/AcrR family transcriptional regulator n=1 Tax=Nocardia takedensis TaxID=259390 RepID=UPI0002EB7764|nr:TetR family transcriptional regulator [Nocardia takedensis]
MEPTGLREQKKQRTRRALIEAALRLFDDKGYEGATVAEIAAAAEVSPATFFNYFPAKDAVVFADDDLYDPLVREAFDATEAGQTPVETLLRVVDHLTRAPRWSFPLDHDLTAVRARLLAEVPALQAGALRRRADLQRRLAAELGCAHPDLTPLHAAALTGAVLGAVDAVLTALSRTSEPTPPEEIPDVVAAAARLAVGGYPS